jgi:uncharacterized circularly permuted ATP-grasp superfamily protein
MKAATKQLWVSATRQQYPDDIGVSLKRCLMQRSAPVLPRKIDLRSFIYQDSSGIRISPYGDYVEHRLAKCSSCGVNGIKFYIREPRQV